MKKIKGFLGKIGICRLVIIILSFILLIGLFLPYQRSIGDERIYLKSNPNDLYVEEIGLKNKDVINISIIENFRVYNYAKDNSDDNAWIRDEAIINFINTIVLMLSIVAILIFVIFRKYILGIIFNVVMALSSLLMNYDIVSRGVVPSKSYTYGISFYLYIILSVIILILLILVIIKKRKDKKSKTEITETKTKVIAEDKTDAKAKAKTEKVIKEKEVAKEKKDKKDKKDKKKNFSFNKTTILYIVGGIIIILLAVVIVLLINNRGIVSRSDNNRDESKVVIFNKKNNQLEIKGKSPKELKTNLKKDYDEVVEGLKNEYVKLKAKTNTVENYIRNKSDVKVFYNKVEKNIKEFCHRIEEYAYRYGEVILNSGKDLDTIYDDIEYLEDDIYLGILSDLDDDIYYGLLDDMSDFYYYGILDDEEDFKSYKEYDEISNEEYNYNSDTSSTVYSLIDQTESKVYDLYSDLYDALYDDKLDQAKEILNDFKKDLK